MINLLVGADQAVERLVGQAADAFSDVGLGEKVAFSLNFDAVVFLQPGFEDTGQNNLVEAPVAESQIFFAAEVGPAECAQQLDGPDLRIEVFKVGEFHRPLFLQTFQQTQVIALPFPHHARQQVDERLIIPLEFILEPPSAHQCCTCNPVAYLLTVRVFSDPLG
ncbi:hypothetical protein [Geoalkalibacter ferrihydriticus]|uniref:hypothetical protein n=1 Tax=Geoalkalibacter ferrihydriticus TaxID=392333 RepID=UPI00129480F8|nr:hypothetical protein [Geoalkalibacter ferrihydriticus]